MKLSRIRNWLAGGQPRYQNIPYNTRTATIYPPSFREVEENTDENVAGDN